jgi:protein-S-isoprenylcysteine O-methyltransferase Ste14
MRQSRDEMADQTELSRALALSAVVTPGATLYFFVFWTWFDFWRKHRVATYTMMLASFVSVAAATVALRHRLLSVRIDMPVWVQACGWTAMGVATVFGFVADRQIGFRIRSFAPFFEPSAHIRLRTTGAYGVVRHPIYAAGRVFIFGTFLATGFPAALIGWVLFGLGAIWFTRQEEKRLITLLDDPSEYERYRKRVPALFPYARMLRTSSG